MTESDSNVILILIRLVTRLKPAIVSVCTLASVCRKISLVKYVLYGILREERRLAVFELGF